jgi:RNA ligase (TIGR02306 family)
MLHLSFKFLPRNLLLNRSTFSSLKMLVKPNRVKPEKPMATINRIVAKFQIPTAESIEGVRVLGWNCVAKKGEFEVGDLCIYFVIGSVFPESYARVDFLKGKPLKTKKLLGVLSQGLVAPLSWLREDFGITDISHLKEGSDVTDIFRIMKHVELEEAYLFPEIAMKSGNGDRKAQPVTTLPFPSYIPKTDEERIQNIPYILNYLQNESVVITRKEDGCSATYAFKDGRFFICSRNLVLPASVEEATPGQRHYYAISQK